MVAWDKICAPTEEGGLGFRDFHDFNLALLAKQMWRLLKYPQSVLARVLKGGYYRHTIPMMIERANNPSYGWRSIVASRQILQQGLRKKIGNGHDTRVWEETWLQTNPARPPLHKTNPKDEDLRVHHLFDFESQVWKSDLLNVMVVPEDIPRIMSIRVSRTGRHDCYSWDYTKSGLYTVKSGYSIARKLRTTNHSTMVSEPSTIRLKKSIWKIKAPRKLKHIFWQSTAGYLATAEQLRERHCARDSTCMRSGAETESINHTLSEYHPALQVWVLSLVPTSPGRFPCTSLYVNIDYLLLRIKDQGLHTDVMDLIPWILWYIWKARNEKIFTNKDVTPLDTLQFAVKEAEIWRLAQKKSEILKDPLEEVQTETHTQAQTICHLPWSCQTDASWIDKEERAGLSFMVMNAGNPMLFGAKELSRASSPLHAEAEGLIWATQEVIKTGNMSVRFELDCEQLLKLILNEEDWPSMAAELDEIKALSLVFFEISIIHIPRSLNVRADCLAKGERSRVINPQFVDCCTPHWLASYAGQNRAC